MRAAALLAAAALAAGAEADPSDERDPLPPTGGPVGIAGDPARGGGDAPRTRFAGYLRTGFGVDEEGGAMRRFLDSRLGRLGNEDTTYGELAVSHDVAVADGARWFVAVRVGFETPNDRLGESVAPAWDEAWVGAEGLVAPGATLWIGKRFYRRRDVHIQDFYYVDDSDPGCGLEDLPTAWGKASFALLAHGADDERPLPGGTTVAGASTDRGRPIALSLDLRLAEIPLAERQRLEIDAIARGSRAGTYVDAAGAELAEHRGMAAGGLSVTHQTDHAAAGRTLVTAQGGAGLADPFVTTALSDDAIAPIVGSPGDRVRTPWLARGVLDHAVRRGGGWQVALAVVGETGAAGRADRGRFARGDLVARPSWWWNGRAGLALEAGWSRLREAGEDDDAVKLTLAVQTRPSRTLFTRPVLRAFVTGCRWSDGLRDRIGRGADPGDAGLNAGVQAEAWW